MTAIERDVAWLATVPRTCICRWEWVRHHWARFTTADGCPWHTRSPR